MAHQITGKRIVFQRASEVEIEDFRLPWPQSRQVLIETVNSLISPGTETAWLNALPNTPMTFPQYPGYSNAGMISAVGEGVIGIHVGDKVFSTQPHATHAVCAESAVSRIPSDISFEEATFTYLVEIALQGVRKARIELGEAVVVIGLGLIGQLALQLARMCGALPAIGIDLLGNRIALAKELGADYAINSKDADVKEGVRALTDGKGASVVIDATGSPLTPPMAIGLVRKFGRIVLLGSTRGETKFSFYSAHLEGVSIIGAHVATRPNTDSSPGLWAPADERTLALKLLSQGKLNVKELVTTSLPFTEAKKAYKMLADQKDSVTGILLTWK